MGIEINVDRLADELLEQFLAVPPADQELPVAIVSSILPIWRKNLADAVVGTEWHALCEVMVEGFGGALGMYEYTKESAH